MSAVIEPILWILFIAGCVLASVVVLLQEGKGGGLGEAFGGLGQQTFGVKAAGISRFTAWVACGVVLLAILITILRGQQGLVGGDVLPAVPADGLPAGTAPATGGDAGGADG